MDNDRSRAMRETKTLRWRGHWLQRRLVLTGLFLIHVAVVVASVSNAAVLYDATLNSQPEAQQWVFLATGNHDRTIGDGVSALDTSADISTLAGYFGFGPLVGTTSVVPVMDLLDTDWSIQFSLQVTSGRDVPDTDPLAFGERNRGVFSLIAISNDLRGVELVFQTDHVLVLDDVNTAFPIGDRSYFNTMGELRNYELLLRESGYELWVTDSTLVRQTILRGRLRHYRSVAPELIGFIYATPNSFFFGDNTGRGAGAVELGFLEVVAVPEPASWMYVVTGLALMLKRWW